MTTTIDVPLVFLDRVGELWERAKDMPECPVKDRIRLEMAAWETEAKIIRERAGDC